MTAYYNENDRKAAAWLRELIKANLIAPGEVDERSILDVTPADLVGFKQCHFFAGIGVWSYALRRAGWADDRPVWTGSCPCQPFSAAGKGEGFADERHLWPYWLHLIAERRPQQVFGEQVASKAGLEWFDLVQNDMEGADYAVGALDLCAAGVNAPHIRQRLWWTAVALGHANEQRPQRRIVGGNSARELFAGPPSVASGLADSEGIGRERWPDNKDEGRREFASGYNGADGILADNTEQRRLARWRPSEEGDGRDTSRIKSGRLCSAGPARSAQAPDEFWRDSDWLFCRDGRWRPVEPGTFPLVNGAPARVGRLRGYGNAINAALAQIFIEEVMAAL